MFAFDLAKELRCPDPDAMRASIPLATFYDWMEYAKRNPFGEERADLRTGIMTSSLVNIQLARGQRRTRPIDYMPLCRKHKKQARQAPMEMRAVLRGAVAAHKGHLDKIAKSNAERS